VVARSTLNTRLHYRLRVEREGGRQPVANLLVNPLTCRSAKPIYQLTHVTPTVSVCGLCIDGSPRLTKRNFVRLLCCLPLAHSGLLTPCLADLIADLANILSVIVSCLNQSSISVSIEPALLLLCIARLGTEVAGIEPQEECVCCCIVSHYSSAYIEALARHDW
jgi:hypothetical protein